MPSASAHIIGPNTVPAAPITACAPSTGQNLGTKATASAATASAATAAAVNTRFARSRSTSAPAGAWNTIAARPPTVSAIPTRCSSQPQEAR
jgi:hypothetical protein